MPPSAESGRHAGMLADMTLLSLRRCLLVGACLSLSPQAGAVEIPQALLEAALGAGSVEVLIEPAGDATPLSLPDDLAFEARVTAAVAALRVRAQARQAALRDRLGEAGIPHRAFWVADAIWARVEARQLAALAEWPEVRAVRGNAPLHAVLPPAHPTAAKQTTAVEWGVQRVNAPAAWARGALGQGVVIAGQDTGYQWNHPALRDRYRGWNGTTASHHHHWHDAIHAIIGSGSNPCGLDATAPCDDNNHGTHTMGTMVGDDGGGNQIGVAPQAKWIGCRNMERGNGTPATYLECFQWFMAPTDLSGGNPDPGLAPHIINNSWGCPPEEGCTQVAMLQQAVDNLRAAGILVVVSAGNSGSGCGSIDTAPAPYPSSFTVGASNSSDLIASFSSRGPATVDGVNFILKPDITGPGVTIRSSIRGGGYGNSSGTSMAGPHVAGVAALLLSAHPQLKGRPAQVEAILRQSARPLFSGQACGGFAGSLSPNAVFGYGLVDAEAAIALAGPFFADGFGSEAAVAR